MPKTEKQSTESKPNAIESALRNKYVDVPLRQRAACDGLIDSEPQQPDRWSILRQRRRSDLLSGGD